MRCQKGSKMHLPVALLLLLSLFNGVLHHFNIFSAISWRQYLCLPWVSPVLGWGSEVSCPRILPRKTQIIQCGSNPGPLDYESKTLPQCHAGSLVLRYKKQGITLMVPKIDFARLNPESLTPGNVKTTKRFGPCQPARIALADMGRYFSQIY